MKYLPLIIFMILPWTLFAQRNPDNTPQDMQIKGVLILGMNMAQVDGDEVFGYYKPGLNAGVGALLPLGKNFYFGVETLFNQKGAYKKFTPAGDSAGKPYYHLKLDYLDVPFLFFYEEKKIWTIGAGASWGRRVHYREVERGIPQDSDSLYAKSDVNLIADLQLRLWQHLKLDVRFAYSVAKLRTRVFTNAAGSVWSRDQFHNLISVRLLYLLNERYVPPDRSKKKQTRTTAYIPAWQF